MNPHRRHFLRSSLATGALVSMGAPTIPLFLGRSARAASESGSRSDHILVVVQLLGGNDGLNTVIPHGLGGYNRGRRALRISPGQIHKITGDIGLHPSMGGFANLLEEGRLAVVQGVGYPNPDRSHFRSMEIWETARADPKALETGWLGRVLDASDRPSGSDLPALNIGARRLPLALKAKTTEAPSIDSLDQYRLQLSGDSASKRAERQALADLAVPDRDDPLLAFVRRTTLAAYDSSKRLEALSSPKKGAVTYPNFGLAKRLELTARIIKAGFHTSIYYTALNGFDTHANQLGTHSALLTELSDSLASFLSDLGPEHSDRVCVLVFSEFGRRVSENASSGTDHGAAAPVFVLGPVAKPGLVGDHPSLDDLDDGDLKHHTDFRRVYASLLDHWLGVPSEPILGPDFEPLPLFSNPKRG